MAFSQILTMPRSREKDRVVNIGVGEIVPNPNQPRKQFCEKDIDELAQSIASCGIIQPLVVRSKNGIYELIAGERRLRAARRAGLTEVPCIVSQADEKRSSLMALTENMQRRDLDYFEEAWGIERIICQSGATQEAAAQKLGKSQSYIANKLRLLRLDNQCVELLRSANLSERHARALLKLDDTDSRISALKHIIKANMKVEQAEKYIERIKTQTAKKKQSLKPVIKDIRLMLNTINRAVELVKSAGIPAEFEKEEGENELRLTITVRR